MYQSNQSKVIEKEIVAQKLTQILKIMTLFDAVRDKNDITFLYETQLSEYMEQLTKLNKEFINKVFLKTRGLENEFQVQERLKLAETSVQDMVYTDRLKEFPTLFGYDPEDFFLTAERADINESDYFSNPMNPLNMMSEQSILKVENNEEIEVTCPFYPIETSDIDSLNLQGENQIPFYVKFTTDTKLSVLKKGLKQALFSMVASLDKKLDRAQTTMKKQNRDGDFYSGKKDDKKKSLKFRIHYIPTEQTFKQFYFEIIMRRKEQRSMLQAEEIVSKKQNKLNVQTFVLHENDLSIASQIEDIIDYGKMFIVEYTTQVQNSLILNGRKFKR